VFVLRAFSTELVAADLFVGTWKLNSAKTKSKIGMPPKQQTVAFSEEGSDLHVMVRGTSADGKAISTHFTRIYGWNPGRSALVYQILTDRPSVSTATAQGVLRRLVGETSGDEASRFIALGIFAARSLNPGLSESATWTKDLLNTLRSRLIRSGAPADPYLAEMFR
jgi:hypothetical protein